jgi:AbiTii-like protein
MVLDEIIALLSDSKASLTDALLKTKVLLHQIGRKELATWVTNELSGYPDHDVEKVPPYRIVGMQPHGHVTNMAWQMTDYLLPILHLPKARQKALTECPFTDPVSAIEDLKAKGAGKLTRPLPAEFGASVRKVLTPGTHVVSAWCEVNMIQVENIVIQVRSRLLDFVLELKDAVGDIPDKELPAKAKEVHAEKIWHQTSYHTGGTLVIGSENVQVNNQQGDIDGLLEEVSKLGFDQGELDELRRAVEVDEHRGDTPSIEEGETSAWYMKALKKVGKGAVDAGVDLVSKTLAELIKHYNGA